MDGIINVYKEAGFTSHDVVAKLRGICRQKKIGHTGTLDPQATGVLPVCLGNATRACEMLTDRTKEYVAELLLGQITDTQDITGTVLEEREVAVSEAQVREVIAGFVGGYDQIPPMYSALKVNGKKLYELARAGKEVERQARHVDLPAIEILEIKFPVVKFRVECSKGTYIRSLCADIGENCAAAAPCRASFVPESGNSSCRCPDTCTAAGTSGHGEAGGSTASHRPYFFGFSHVACGGKVAETDR